MIPKHITTMWLNDKEGIPELVERCVETQRNLPGYEHRLITLDNCYMGSDYLRDALAAKMWVKAKDFLSMHYLYWDGGIFLDADCEMVRNPDGSYRNFDHLLHHGIFCCWEYNGFIGNAFVGTEKEHPIVGQYLNRVTANFRGSGDMIFEPGMRLWSDTVYWALDDEALKIEVLPSEVAFPYNHEAGTTNMTDDTITYHYYMKTWKK